MSCFSIKRMSAFRAQMTAFFAALILLISALPAHAERLPEFLAKIQPSEIFPGADRYGKPEGKPMVARVYKGDEQRVWFILQLMWLIRAVIRVSRLIR